MTVVVSDAFVGTAGTALQSHTGAVGATWSKNAASSGGDVQITSSGYVGAAAGGSGARYTASGVPTTTGYDIDVDIFIHDSTVQSGRPRVIARASSSTDLFQNCYYARFDYDVAYIYKVVAGVETQLAFYVQPTYTTGSTHHMTFTVRAAGTLLEVVIDGVSRMTSNDTTFTGIGSVGLMYNGGDTPGSGHWLTNYVVTDTASGGGGRTFQLPSGLDGLSSAGPKQFNPSLG